MPFVNAKKGFSSYMEFSLAKKCSELEISEWLKIKKEYLVDAYRIE
jgi:hypothetical protein